MAKRKDLAKHYDSGFYDTLRSPSYEAGVKILPHVLDLFPVHSMIDFGCGLGSWLTAASELGIKVTDGVEGEWALAQPLKNENVKLHPHNLEEPFHVTRTYDLAMSLEVAEHLSPSRAAAFVSEICSASKKVLFSAAIPHQGGTNHINERRQSYWSELFGSCNYKAIDALRPLIWQDSELPIHYRQNILLYIHADEYKDVLATVEEKKIDPILDLVHPDLLERRMADQDLAPNLKESLSAVLGLPGAVIRSIKDRV